MNPSCRTSGTVKTTMLSSYTSVLRYQGAWHFSLAAFVARLPIAMNALGIVLLVSITTGSFGLAGVLSATYTIAAGLVSPISSRFVDRLGQRAVLLPLALLDAALLVALAGVVVIDMPFAVQLLVALLAGAAHPNVGSLVRARWVHVLAGTGRLRSAFAWESVLDELIFTIGPIAATFLAISVTPTGPLIVAAVLTAIGSVWFVALRSSEPPPRPATEHAEGRMALRYRGMVVAFLAAIGLGGVFGSYEVSVVAYATEQGLEEWAGPVLALWAGGSLIAGLLFGARSIAMPLGRMLVITSALLTVALVAAPFTSNLAFLAIATFLSGFLVAPSLITLFGVTEQLVPVIRLTEGLTWTNSGIAMGFAAGAALGGAVIDSAGASVAFWLAVGFAFLAAASAALGYRRTTQPNPM